MTTQTKEQQAVALAEKYGSIWHGTNETMFKPHQLTALLADHAQQVREAHTAELVAKDRVMPATWTEYISGGLCVTACNPSEVREAIAAMQAKNERLTAALKRANDQAEHFEREGYLRGDALEQSQARIDDTDFKYEGALNSIREHQQIVLELRARVAELERDASDYAKLIANENPHGENNWACARCHPDSEILIPGFTCVVHRAIDTDAAMKKGGGV